VHASLAALAVMWAAMMAVMMAPAATPSFVLHARMARRATASAAYLTGYLGLWILVGVAYALAHWGLQRAGLLGAGMRLTDTTVAGTLLIAAGAWQWSPVKATCVSRCRSPLGFMLNDWREGVGGALQMGFRYAGYCVGCCWLVMTVLFVVGAMNVAWAALIALYVLAERLLPFGRSMDRALGAALAAWGAWLVWG